MTRPGLTIDDVYVATDPLGSRAFRGAIDPGLDLYAIARGEARPPGPIVVTHASGGTLYDVIWTQNVAPLLVSDRVVELFRRAGISGWGTHDVRVTHQDGDEVDGYVGLVVQGRCGPIRDDMSPVVDEVLPGGRFKSYQGWYFDPATWDGSDIFVPSDSGVIRFITSRVRKLLNDHKVRNIRMLKATDPLRPKRP